MKERKPEFFGWEITSRCNLSCPHCFSPPDRSDKSELTVDECMRIIDSVGACGAELIGWTGGEPLLFDGLERLIAYALSGYKIKSGITTNGILLDEKRLARLMEAGVHTVQISLDGSNAERNHRIRLTNDEDFARIMQAIRLCVKHDVKINMAMLLGADNLDDAPEMIKLAKNEGVRVLRFCGFTPVGRAASKSIKKKYIMNYDHLLQLNDFIEKARHEEDLTVMFDPGFGPIPPDYEFHECVAGIETVYLKANGNVYPCTALLYDEFIVGNIRERSFADIWDDPAMTTMAQFPRDEVEGACRSCDNFSECRGACRPTAFAHTGNFLGSFPACLYRAEKRQPTV